MQSEIECSQSFGRCVALGHGYQLKNTNHLRLKERHKVCGTRLQHSRHRGPSANPLTNSKRQKVNITTKTSKEVNDGKEEKRLVCGVLVLMYPSLLARKTELIISKISLEKVKKVKIYVLY